MPVHDTAPSADVLICTLFYLMSRYPTEKDARLAMSIKQHLQLLEQHAGLRSEVMQKTCEKLARRWQRLEDRRRDALPVSAHAGEARPTKSASEDRDFSASDTPAEKMTKIGVH